MCVHTSSHISYRWLPKWQTRGRFMVVNADYWHWNPWTQKPLKNFSVILVLNTNLIVVCIQGTMSFWWRSLKINSRWYFFWIRRKPNETLTTITFLQCQHYFNIHLVSLASSDSVVNMESRKESWEYSWAENICSGNSRSENLKSNLSPLHRRFGEISKKEWFCLKERGFIENSKYCLEIKIYLAR